MKKSGILLKVIALVALLGASAAAQEAMGPQQVIEPAADKALHAMSDYLAGLKSMRFKVEATTEVTLAGLSTPRVTSYAIAVKRPDKLSVVLENGPAGMTVVSNGEKTWLHMPTMRTYSEQETQLSAGDLATTPALDMLRNLYATAFLVDDPYTAITSGVANVRFIGAEDVAGMKCSHLRFEGGMGRPWDLWISEGEKPLPRKAIPEIKPRPGSGMNDNDMKFTITVLYKDWEANPDIQDDVFVFKPPAKTRQVRPMFGALTPPRSSDTEEPALLGKLAPDFTLKQLDGGQVTLSQFKGKNIVVIDFWETGCVFCVDALPMEVELTKSFADKGVVFYAVDVGDSVEDVKAFLKMVKVDCKVLLDTDEKVFDQLYKLEGFPTDIIVDKNGRIQSIDEGAPPTLKRDLTRKLNALVAGKELVKSKDAPPEK